MARNIATAQMYDHYKDRKHVNKILIAHVKQINAHERAQQLEEQKRSTNLNNQVRWQEFKVRKKVVVGKYLKAKQQ